MRTWLFSWPSAGFARLGLLLLLVVRRASSLEDEIGEVHFELSNDDDHEELAVEAEHDGEFF